MKIRHITVPVLFISGAQDELVPPQMMQRLHDVCTRGNHLSNHSFVFQECQSLKKQLIIIPDGQHNTTWISQNYAYYIRQFLNEVNDRIANDSLHIGSVL